MEKNQTESYEQNATTVAFIAKITTEKVYSEHLLIKKLESDRFRK